MLITLMKVFNLKDKEIQRVFDIKSIKGVTKSVSEDQGELVLHVEGSYDYRYKSEYRNEIITVLKASFMTVCKKDLPIYGVKQKTLKDFTTSQNDVKKGVCRIPLELARLKFEDTIGDESKPSEAAAESDDFHESIQNRAKQYQNQLRRTSTLKFNPQEFKGERR